MTRIERLELPRHQRPGRRLQAEQDRLRERMVAQSVAASKWRAKNPLNQCASRRTLRRRAEKARAAKLQPWRFKKNEAHA